MTYYLYLYGILAIISICGQVLDIGKEREPLKAGTVVLNFILTLPLLIYIFSK